MSVPAIIAGISVAQAILDCPLVKRLLTNIAKRSPNEIDDWVVGALYDIQINKKTEDEAKAALNKVQSKYDALSEEEKAKAKANPAVIATDFKNFLPAGVDG